jgi:hypothetical protein
MHDDNLRQLVAIFGEGGEIEKLAGQTHQPVSYTEPCDSLKLLKLAADGDALATVLIGLSDYYQDDNEKTFKSAIAVSLSFVDDVLAEMDKTAEEAPVRRHSTLLDRLGVISQFWDGEIAGIPNRPGPLSSMLVLGSLGAATGNIAGRIAGRTNMFDRKRAKRMGTLIGGGLGLLPGLGYAYMNYAAGKPPLSGDVLNMPRLEGIKTSYVDPLMFSRPDLIPVERMQQMIWEDPRVAGRLPVSVAAAASALVEGASRQRPRAFPYVTPTEIARMAMGMGAGYTGGMLAGKALGALFGVSDQSQQVLRETGAAAGVIRSFIPLAFGA